MKRLKIAIGVSIAMLTLTTLTGCSASKESQSVASYAESLPQVTLAKASSQVLGDAPKVVSSVDVVFDDSASASTLIQDANNIDAYGKSKDFSNTHLVYHGVQFSPDTTASSIQFIYDITRNDLVHKGEFISYVDNKSKRINNIDIEVSKLSQLVPMALHLNSFPNVQNATIGSDVHCASDNNSPFRIQETNTPGNIEAAKILQGIKHVTTFDVQNGSISTTLSQNATSSEQKEITDSLNDLKTHYKADWVYDIEIVPSPTSS